MNDFFVILEMPYSQSDMINLFQNQSVGFTEIKQLVNQSIDLSMLAQPDPCKINQS